METPSPTSDDITPISFQYRAPASPTPALYRAPTTSDRSGAAGGDYFSAMNGIMSVNRSVRDVSHTDRMIVAQDGSPDYNSDEDIQAIFSRHDDRQDLFGRHSISSSDLIQVERDIEGWNQVFTEANTELLVLQPISLKTSQQRRSNTSADLSSSDEMDVSDNNNTNTKPNKEEFGNVDYLFQERMKALRGLVKEIEDTDWMFNAQSHPL